MNYFKSSCLFLVAFGIVGCSKSVRNNGQPQSPVQLGATSGQQTNPPNPQESSLPIASASPTAASGSTEPQPIDWAAPAPAVSPSATKVPAPLASIKPVIPTPVGSIVPVASPAPSSTTTPSLGDTLKARYDSAILRCDLEFPLEYDYRVLGIESLGSDSFTWNLLTSYADQKAFVLNANAKPFRKDLIVNINVESVTLEADTLSINGTYKYESATPISFLKMTSAVMGEGPLAFYENTENRLVDDYIETSTGNASDEYEILLQCGFETKIKSETAIPMATTSAL